MAHDFYQPEQVARTAVALAEEDAFLSALVSRDLTDDFFGGGGKGRTVNIKVPSALIARDRDIDDKSTAITMDELSETTVPLTLGTHAYSAVRLSEGDLNLNLASFAAQVLKPQTDAVGEYVENEVATVLNGLTTFDISDAPSGDLRQWSEANPVLTFTDIRKVLRKRGVPVGGLNCVVGTNVYAALLDAKALDDASQSGSTAALREGNVGRIRGLTVVESTRVDDDDIIAFHRNAFTLAVRAPAVPAGASFGAAVRGKGFALRYLRDYDVMTVSDRSLVSTFVGVVAMPLYRVSRDYDATTVSVSAVTGGASIRVTTA